MKQPLPTISYNIMPYKFLLSFIILLAVSPAHAFPTMPVGSFDSLGYFSFFSTSADGERTFEDEMNDENNNENNDDMNQEKNNIDRSGLNAYFSFAPTSNWAVYIHRTEVTLNEEDWLYEEPAGPKNTLKTGYDRTGLGVRGMFFNRRGSPVKVGIYNEVSLNNTADQDGESFSVMPFFYIGHDLPISVRYGYNVETSRRKTRLNDSSFGSTDNFYSSHLYVRIDPYNSVARFPVGYEFYQRSGTAPDPVNFDVLKEEIIEHSIFFRLPASFLLTLKVETSNDAQQISLGVEAPFF
ncbi:MAG: hypothetical protein K0U39_00955 [Alphaproteobacteria bacterium]|nr:hypothetical protein [Alphaproteobacteria bacterium]